MFPEITLSAFSGLTHIDFSVPANSRYVELDIKGIGVNDIIISKDKTNCLVWSEIYLTFCL